MLSIQNTRDPPPQQVVYVQAPPPATPPIPQPITPAAAKVVVSDTAPISTESSTTTFVVCPPLTVESGDLYIRAGLGLQSDGKIVFQNADHSTLAQFDSTTLEVFGNLVLHGELVRLAPTIETVTKSATTGARPQQRSADLVTLRPAPVVDSTTTVSVPVSSDRPRSVVHRINVDRDTTLVKLKLTSGTGILDIRVGSSPEESPLDVDISVVWDMIVSETLEPIVLCQLVGPPLLDFRVVEVDNEGMKAVLMSNDGSSGVRDCKVHYSIVDT